MQKVMKFKRTILFFIRILNIAGLTALMAYAWYTYYAAIIPTPLFRKGNYLVIFIYFIIITALAIKFEDGGPIFYKQDRLTKNGKVFKILKFRSMIVDAEKIDGAQLMTEKDPRVTHVGHIIRKLRIDELPQLINIIKGDMSIVGPRPERPEIAEEYYKELPEFRYRLNGKAGLTGYAQVMGKYNTSFADKLLYDMMYLENYSLIFDLKIMLMTIKTIFNVHATEGVKEENKE